MSTKPGQLQYGPVRTVVWEGRSREAPPYPDCAPVLRMTAAADRAGSPCGPAERLARDRLPASATPAIRSAVAEHRRYPPDGITCTFPGASGGQGHPDTKSYGRGSGSGSTHPGTMRVEAGTVAEHCAGDVQQAVGHRAQGARVSVAPGAQRLVLAVADRITLDGDARPIEDGVAQSVVGRPPLYHE